MSKQRGDERLARIAQIIERVDLRCAAVDGPVTPTLQEMTQKELSEIYSLSREGKVQFTNQLRERLAGAEALLKECQFWSSDLPRNLGDKIDRYLETTCE